MLTEFQTLKMAYLEESRYLLSQSTRDKHSRILDNLESFLPKDIKSVNSSNFEAWHHSLTIRGLKASSLKTYLAVVDKWFTYLVYNGTIPRNPIPWSIRLGKVIRPLENYRFPSEDELQAVVEASKINPMHYSILNLIYENGLNHFELSLLRKCDFQAVTRILMVTNRKGEQHLVKISSQCLVALQEYLESRLDESETLFLLRNGNALSTNAINSIIRRYTRSTGSKAFTIQDFRRALILRLGAIGFNSEEIAHFLGFRSMHYVYFIRHLGGDTFANRLNFRNITASEIVETLGQPHHFPTITNNYLQGTKGEPDKLNGYLENYELDPAKA